MVKKTVVFKKTASCELKADVYDKGNNSPVLIYLHGGGFIFGSRSWLPPSQIEFFSEHGFSLVSVDYRLSPETKLPDIVQDLKDAFDWLVHHSGHMFGFNPLNFAVIGSSAGGYAALLMGAMELRPKAIVSLYGYGDLLGDWITKPSGHYNLLPAVKEHGVKNTVNGKETAEGGWGRYDYYLYCRQKGIWVQEVTGYEPAKDRDTLLEFCPIHRITNNYPPALLLRGEEDTDVPIEQSKIMNEKLAGAGIHSELITITGGGHVFDQNFSHPDVQAAFQKVKDFLWTHLH